MEEFIRRLVRLWRRRRGARAKGGHRASRRGCRLRADTADEPERACVCVRRVLGAVLPRQLRVCGKLAEWD